MERVAVFVDGGNLYHLVHKKLGITEMDFDLDAFVTFLAGTRTVTDKRYYIGTVREKAGDERSRRFVAAQVRYLAQLRNQKWETKTSKLRTRIEELPIDSRVEGYAQLQKAGIKTIRYERLREKGIDVKLSTDLIMGALDGRFDSAILVSSDGDLVPAVDWVRGRFKKKVEYVGFSISDQHDPTRSTKPLLSMIARSDAQRILTAEDLRPFVLPHQAGLGLAA